MQESGEIATLAQHCTNIGYVRVVFAGDKSMIAGCILDDGWNVLDQLIERKSQLSRIIIIFCVLTSNYNGYWSEIGVMFTHLKW